jgi:hypothetical protein
MWVQGTNLCKVYNCHDSHAYDYKRSGILSRLVGFGCGMVWFGFCLACVESYDLSNPSVDHTCRILIQLNWVVITYNFNIVIWC